MAPEHTETLMYDDFNEDELRQGRQRLQRIMGVLEKKKRLPEFSAGFSVSEEQRSSLYRFRRDNLDALILRRTGGHCKSYLLLKQPAVSLDLPYFRTSTTPRSELDATLDGVAAITVIFMMTA